MRVGAPSNLRLSRRVPILNEVMSARAKLTTKKNSSNNAIAARVKAAC
jgi:hypothetical protein